LLQLDERVFVEAVALRAIVAHDENVEDAPALEHAQVLMEGELQRAPLLLDAEKDLETLEIVAPVGWPLDEQRMANRPVGTRLRSQQHRPAVDAGIAGGDVVEERARGSEQ